MISDFDYLSVAQDIIARANAQELEFLYAANRARQDELRIEGTVPSDTAEASDPSKEPISGIVERRSHDNGELVLARRAFIRKHKTRVWRGPY